MGRLVELFSLSSSNQVIKIDTDNDKAIRCFTIYYKTQYYGIIKRLSLILLLLCTTSSLWSNGGLQFKGKLRILRPTTLQVKDLNGNLVLTCSISQNGVFETEKKEIQPDVYTLCIGKTEQNIYFENTSVSINGFFDEKNPEQSSLSFTGIDPFLTLQNYMPAERDPDKATISTSAKEKLTPAMASAISLSGRCE